MCTYQSEGNSSQILKATLGRFCLTVWEGQGHSLGKRPIRAFQEVADTVRHYSLIPVSHPETFVWLRSPISLSWEKARWIKILISFFPLSQNIKWELMTNFPSGTEFHLEKKNCYLKVSSGDSLLINSEAKLSRNLFGEARGSCKYVP